MIINNDPESVRNWRIDQVLTGDLFGLESARPPETEKLLSERAMILSKMTLSEQDQKKLVEIESQIRVYSAVEKFRLASSFSDLSQATKDQIRVLFPSKLSDSELETMLTENKQFVKNAFSDGAPYAGMIRANFPDHPDFL